MKKAAILLALFYLLNAVGYGLEVHYCLGEVADINYVFLDTSCACEDNHIEISRSNCCNEESFFNQLDDEHQAAASDFSVKAPVAQHIFCLNDIQNVLFQEIKLPIQSLRAPPEPIERILLYHTFILYA